MVKTDSRPEQGKMFKLGDMVVNGSVGLIIEVYTHDKYLVFWYGYEGSSIMNPHIEDGYYLRPFNKKIDLLVFNKLEGAAATGQCKRGSGTKVNLHHLNFLTFRSSFGIMVT